MMLDGTLPRRGKCVAFADGWVHSQGTPRKLGKEERPAPPLPHE